MVVANIGKFQARIGVFNYSGKLQQMFQCRKCEYLNIKRTGIKQKNENGYKTTAIYYFVCVFVLEFVCIFEGCHFTF